MPRLPLNNPPAPSTLFGVPDPNAKFGRHAGIDYPVGTGTPVYACISGTVSTVQNDPYHGNVVDIQSGDKWYRVMHLKSFVKMSGHVNEGDLIAYSDNTGLSTGPHLHWDVRTEYNPTSFNAFINPLTLIGGIMPADQVAEELNKRDKRMDAIEKSISELYTIVDNNFKSINAQLEALKNASGGIVDGDYHITKK